MTAINRIYNLLLSRQRQVIEQGEEGPPFLSG